MASNITSRITVDDLPKTFTFQQVIDEWCPGASLRSMKEAATAGKFEHIRIGNAWLMTPSQIAAFLEYRVKKTKPAADRRASTRARHQRKIARASRQESSAA